jgi:hypothetical protein
MDNPEKTGTIGHTRWRQTKQKHNTICVGHHYTQANTNNVNKTWALLQTTGGQDEQNIVEIIYQSCYPMRWLFLVLNNNVVVSGILVAQSLVYV